MNQIFFIILDRQLRTVPSNFSVDIMLLFYICKVTLINFRVILESKFRILQVLNVFEWLPDFIQKIPLVFLIYTTKIIIKCLSLEFIRS